MTVFVMVTMLLLADGSSVAGQDYEFAGWRNQYLSTAHECVLQAERQIYYPTYGEVVAKITYCEPKTFY